MTVFNCNVCCYSFFVSGHKTFDDDDDDDLHSACKRIIIMFHRNTLSIKDVM